ncbi:MAG TPA: DUF4349 domain-containing protein [Candidatus Dormibacteraeota bacterium]|jgi:hypothetical protein
MHRNKLVLLVGSLVALLAVACGGSGASTASRASTASSAPAGAGVAQSLPAQAAPASGSSAAKSAPETVAPAAPNPEGPRVQRSARVALQVPNGRFDATLNDVITVVEQAGGYISGQDAQALEDGQPLRSGQVTFQVPAARFEAVVSDIRRKGTAQTITISGNDVSQQYVDLQARLRNAEAQRDAMLALMQRATTVADTIQVQNQLGQVTAQIEQLHGQIDYLDHSTAFATVAVTIREVALTGSPHDDWGLQTAVTQAAHNVVGVVAFLVVVLSVLIPLLILGAVLFVVGRVAWRRFRWEMSRAPASERAVE